MAVILFADIVDSTVLTERMGDSAFRALARRLDAGLRATIRECSGRPIEGKLLGDGVLAIFDSAQRAVECAMRCSREGSTIGLPLHVGLHAGDVIREANNVFGGAVNIAARVAAASGPGEVLVSDTVRNLARTSSDVAFEDRGAHDLKGIGEPLRLFRAQRRHGGLTLASRVERRSGHRSRFFWVGAFVSLVLLIAASATAGILVAQNVLDSDDEQHTFAQTTLPLGDETLLLDVAHTEEEQRQIRLRDRSKLADGTGLLYDGVQPATSWGTIGYHVPVDLVWIDAAKTVIAVTADVRQVAAANEGDAELSVPADARYAIELNSGDAARRGIQAGTQLTFFLATTIMHGDRRINAEVACTLDEQLNVGLAERQSLDEDSALLYDWSLILAARTLEIRTWSTRDYLFPIDIIWLDQDKKVISVVPDVAPNTTAISQPDGMHYAIEMNSGAGDRLGLTPGTVLEFEVPCDP